MPELIVNVHTTMRGVLHNITKKPEPNVFDVVFSVGDEPPEHFRVSYERSEERGQKYICWDDGGLLPRITKLGDRGLVDNWFYENEMMHILFAFERGEAIPQLPVELGTTSFWKPPSIFRILWNRIRRFFWRRGLFVKRLASAQTKIEPGQNAGQNAG